MCGISVAVHPAGSDALVSIIERMHAPIRHRGPDGEGFLLADSQIHRTDRLVDLPAIKACVAAAFRRLNILDLSSAASQPMLAPSRPIAILMNGEIYNFRQLRSELEALGRAFKSTGDTEVALAAYERWGSQCFSRLEGMWAIVIVDLERQSVVVSRDRFGIKPLYWSLVDGQLLFASECKQLTAVAPPSADEAVLAMFLAGQRVPMLEETFFRNIRAVPPATWAEIPLHSIAVPRFQSYWNHAWFSANGNGAPSYDAAVDTLDELLRNAVQSHRQSDVPVGALLSGGIDSSTLTVMLSETGAAVPTYSFGFRENAPEVCEMRYVDEIVRAGRFENAETTFDPAWIRENTWKVIRALEEPVLALPPLAQYRLLEFCGEKGRTVIIDGQGADEIFGGYEYHQYTYLRDMWKTHRYGEFTREARAIKRSTGQSMAATLARNALVRGVRSVLPKKNGSWIRQDFGKRSDPRELADAIADRGKDAGLVNRQIHFDLRWGNAKTILAFGDKNGMAHSIEVRVPFFDRRVVELALTIPDSYKVRNGDRKRVLRDVARRRLPPLVTERKDRLGFGVPEQRWFRRQLWPFIKPIVNDPGLTSAPCFDAQNLRRFLADFDAGRSTDSRGIWRLYTLAHWKQEFAVAL